MTSSKLRENNRPSPFPCSFPCNSNISQGGELKEVTTYTGARTPGCEKLIVALPVIVALVRIASAEEVPMNGRSGCGAVRGSVECLLRRGRDMVVLFLLVVLFTELLSVTGTAFLLLDYSERKCGRLRPRRPMRKFRGRGMKCGTGRGRLIRCLTS